ncbi:hypothetical protein M2651_04500 [Clostridium sp. SYSU_GA19001]|uniref:hypothetical protein n=1 Tax=Clostridium caldaquaticum TaxID=2940653 RepID=UPI002076F9B8|nr:hypothetical protein [Clostridium caldaquaticum]MCM8710286.1 hypothetical protein [Clostridium caldaquaticum]
MNGLKRQLKFQITDWKKAFTMFWCILIAINILLYILSIYKNVSFGATIIEVKNKYDEIPTKTVYMNGAFGNIIPIGIFIIVYSMVMYYETFSTAIGFSSTRKNFYLSNIISSSMLCFAMAILEGTLLKIDKYIVKAMGKLPLNHIMYFNLDKDNVIFVIYILFLLAIVFCSLFNLMGALVYRFGYKIWIGAALLVVLLGNISITGAFLGKLGVFIFTYDNFIMFSLRIIITTAILYAIAWGLVRKMPVKSEK